MALTQQGDKLVLQTVGEDGCDLDVTIPAHYEVCSRCYGKGRHDHPAFANGITMEEWHGPDWDDESREQYMAGAYDVPCEVCKGARVELVPDEQQTPEVMAALREDAATRREMEAEQRSERFMLGEY